MTDLNNNTAAMLLDRDLDPTKALVASQTDSTDSGSSSSGSSSGGTDPSSGGSSGGHKIDPSKKPGIYKVANSSVEDMPYQVIMACYMLAFGVAIPSLLMSDTMAVVGAAERIQNNLSAMSAWLDQIGSASNTSGKNPLPSGYFSGSSGASNDQALEQFCQKVAQLFYSDPQNYPNTTTKDIGVTYDGVTYVPIPVFTSSEGGSGSANGTFSMKWVNVDDPNLTSQEKAALERPPSDLQVLMCAMFQLGADNQIYKGFTASASDLQGQVDNSLQGLSNVVNAAQMTDGDGTLTWFEYALSIGAMVNSQLTDHPSEYPSGYVPRSYFSNSKIGIGIHTLGGGVHYYSHLFTNFTNFVKSWAHGYALNHAPNQSKHYQQGSPMDNFMSMIQVASNNTDAKVQQASMVAKKNYTNIKTYFGVVKTGMTSAAQSTQNMTQNQKNQ